MKNGKRDKNYLEASRALSVLSQSQVAASSQPATISAPSTNRTISDQVALSSVMKELNMLKESMRTLVSEVSILHRDKAAATRAPSTCHVSVLCKQPCSAHELPSLLGCPVLITVLLGAGLSWKVKIHKENLYNALQSSSESHSVHIWKNDQSKVVSVPTLSAPPCSSKQDYISIVTWNCRRYHNSKHYLQDMIAKGADIIVLQEHWLSSS